jgi:hypothetical protein
VACSCHIGIMVVTMACFFLACHDSIIPMAFSCFAGGLVCVAQHGVVGGQSIASVLLLPVLIINPRVRCLLGCAVYTVKVCTVQATGPRRVSHMMVLCMPCKSYMC